MIFYWLVYIKSYALMCGEWKVHIALLLISSDEFLSFSDGDDGQPGFLCMNEAYSSQPSVSESHIVLLFSSGVIYY